MNTPKPMLAGMYLPRVAKFPIDVHLKFDGLHCMVSARDLIHRSRGGETYRLPNIYRSGKFPHMESIRRRNLLRITGSVPVSTSCVR